MNKKDREIVFNKYNGHCAYCGVEMDIKAMQVDHLIPQRLGYTFRHHEAIHCEENYMPSCRSCNNYKSGNPIEAFRLSIENQIKVLRRDRPTFRLDERFGLIECTPKDVVFYFENFK